MQLRCFPTISQHVGRARAVKLEFIASALKPAAAGGEHKNQEMPHLFAQSILCNTDGDSIEHQEQTSEESGVGVWAGSI